MRKTEFNGTIITRLFKQGNSNYILIPKIVIEQASLRSGDVLVIRPAGEKLILERIAVEKLAILRTGDAVRTV